MKSVDTNIVIRLITGDDSRQTPLARAAFECGVFVPDGVLMEAEWVLRSFYDWGHEQINAAFVDLVTSSAVHVSDRGALLWCLERHLLGADLADMLHIVASRSNEAFLTFETKMVKRAGANVPVPIEVLQ